jgi:uncharacterized protein YoxC
MYGHLDCSTLIKKLSKLDTVSADLCKLSTKVDGLSREVNSVNKRLDDVEESSKFVGAKLVDNLHKSADTVSSFDNFFINVI